MASWPGQREGWGCRRLGVGAIGRFPGGGGAGGGFLHSLGSAREMVLASETLTHYPPTPPREMGMIMTAPCIQAAHRGPHQHVSFPPFLIPSTVTTPPEEPTATAWGFEGPSLRPGQPSPALEDWEGESSWVQVLALLWTHYVSSGWCGHVRRGHKG